MNNKVNFLRGTSTEYEASTKDNDTFYYTTDDEKLYLGNKEITGIEIDDTSTTATDKTWSAKKISDSIPTTLPANGGNADTLDGLHANEIASNPNLLINPDFKINQRGQSEYSQSSKQVYKYSVDNWAIYKHSSTETGDVSMTLNSSGGIVLNNQTDGKAAIFQRIENFSDLFGKQVTFSASIDGIILSLTVICSNMTGQIGNVTWTDDKMAYLRVYAVLDNRLEFEIYLQPGASITVDWTKVEIGDVATPFVSPNPATELAKCQRYFNSLFVNGIPVQFVGNGIAVSNTMATILVNLPVVMRLPTPTVSLTGTLYLNDGNHIAENSIAVQSISASYLDRTMLQLNLSTSSDITLDRLAAYLLLRRDVDTILTISAEL